MIPIISERPKILIVEDESIVALHIKNSLKRLGYDVFDVVSSGEEALKVIDNAKPDLTLMDIQLGGRMDGIETAEILFKQHQIPIIYLTAFADGPTIERAKNTEPYGYLIKPFEEKDLRGALEMALYKNKIENKLRESEERYNSLFYHSLSLVFIHDLEGNFIDINQAFVDLLGYSKTEILNMHFSDLFSKEQFEDTLKIIESLRFGEQPNKIHQFKIKKKNGELAYLELASSLINRNGVVVAIQGVARDVTDRKAYEERLIKSKEEAEKSDKLKTEFLAQISHEIRTPVNNIVTFTSLLKDEMEDKLPTGLESAFKIIDSSAKRLIRTIDLILNISQLQSGNFETNFEVLDLNKNLLDDLLLEFYSKAKAKNLELTLENSSNETIVLGDNYTIKQIFANLIDNAIKYTSAGEVKIHLYKNKIDKMCVDIIDSGIGISEEYIPFVFEPFTQEDTGYSRRFEGNGLGLALVKKYVELNKASISVSSEKGKGSTFTVAFDQINI
ncbi:MAG: PAS domain S-box protein [Ignavibacteriaceae bacterium]|jgi:PAS domain S-box-containing protein